MIDNWIQHNYDRAVEAAGINGIKTSEARQAIVGDVVQMLVRGEVDQLDFTRQAEAMVDEVITPSRRGRKTVLHRELSDLIAAVRGETILGRDDPRLKQAFPLGDGRDKMLGLWDADDWNGALKVRKDKRDEITVSVQIFEDQVHEFIAAMQSAGAAITIDVLPKAA